MLLTQVAAERSYPTLWRSGVAAKEWRLRGCRRAERSYSTFKIRSADRGETPIVQGKEQWLHFAAAAVKRYPTFKVRETQIRW